MPKRSDVLLIEDIIENAETIFEFVSNDSYESFVSNKMKLYAVIRAFEIIGEAAKAISEQVKEKYPLIEWREMSDFRNILTHHYFGVENKMLWFVIQNDLPYNYELLKEVQV